MNSDPATPVLQTSLPQQKLSHRRWLDAQHPGGVDGGSGVSLKSYAHSLLLHWPSTLVQQLSTPCALLHTEWSQQWPSHLSLLLAQDWHAVVVHSSSNSTARSPASIELGKEPKGGGRRVRVKSHCTCVNCFAVGKSLEI